MLTQPPLGMGRPRQFDFRLGHDAGGLAALRFTLLLVGALILGLAAFYVAGYGIKRLRLLLFLLIASFLLVLICEFVGRTIFYEAMTRVGV